MANEPQSGFVNFEELFGKPIEEVTDEELLEKAQELRTRRKYPSVDKAKGKKADKVEDLISGIIVQAEKNQKDNR